MAVLLVVGRVYFEWCELCATFRRHTLRRALFLRGHQLQLEFAKLQVGAQAEERAGALHERRVAGERYVTAFHELYDLILLAVVLQLHVLRVEVEGGVGVVVQVHVHLVAHLTVDVEVNLLVEVHRCLVAVAHRQRGVVYLLVGGAKLQLGRTLRSYAHTARTEYFLGRSEVEVHVGKVEFLLSLGLVDLVVLRTEVGVARMLLAPLEIFVGGHHERRGEIRSPKLGSNDVAVERVVVDHLIAQPLRALQVEHALVEVAIGDGCGALYLPSGVEQRVGYRVVVDDEVVEVGAIGFGVLFVILPACFLAFVLLCAPCLPTRVNLLARVHDGIGRHGDGQPDEE